MALLPKPTLTIPPAIIPARGSSTFSADASAWVTYESSLYGDLTEVLDWVSDSTELVEENAAISVSAASDAVAAGGAELHITTQNYAMGDAAISNVNLLTYRANTAVSGSIGSPSPDPSADASWTLIGFSRSYDDLTDTPALGGAAALNVGTEEGNVVQLGEGGAMPAVHVGEMTGFPQPGVLRATKITIASGVAEVIIPMPTGNGPVMIEGRNLKLNTDSRLYMRTSTDGTNFNSAVGAYQSFGSDVTQVEVGVNNEDYHDFFVTAINARKSASVFRVFGEVFSGLLAGIGGSESQHRIRFCRKQLEAVTHLKVYVSGATFTSGEIFVSQIIDPT